MGTRTLSRPASDNSPLKRIEDYRDKVPASWVEKGGVFLPIHQREAMWIQFRQKTHLPCAVRVGIGKVSAITGETWKAHLQSSPQDYLVTPPQAWLDGIKHKDGKVRQFVAMALGQGYTIEGQITGKEEHGGVQIAVYPGKEERFPKPPTRLLHSDVAPASYLSCSTAFASYSTAMPLVRSFTHKAATMGMGAGGLLDQEIYKDPHGIDAWDQTKKERVFVHLVNAELWTQITGEAPPKSPLTKEAYQHMGIPWFSLQDEELAGTASSEILDGVKSISEMDKKHGFEGQQDDSPMEVGTTINCGKPQVVFDKITISDGNW